MTSIGKTLNLLVLLALATGCVQTQPLIAHSHIGHALTTWHDTPGQQGLYVIAAKELDIAIAATGKALESTAYPARSSKHVDNALHALNPDRQRFGVGLDYGAIRAIQGAIEHLEYAADSDDASDNFVSSVVILADQGNLVLERMRQAEQLLAAIDRNQPVNDPRLLKGHRLLKAAKHGDSSGGPVGNTLARSEHGLVHITEALADMLKRETDPDYEPVPRRYVLGLVKLPNGRWGYRLARPVNTRSGYGY